jgi:hypothetical protein
METSTHSSWALQSVSWSLERIEAGMDLVGVDRILLVSSADE